MPVIAELFVELYGDPYVHCSLGKWSQYWQFKRCLSIANLGAQPDDLPSKALFGFSLRRIKHDTNCTESSLILIANGDRKIRRDRFDGQVKGLSTPTLANAFGFENRTLG